MNDVDAKSIIFTDLDGSLLNHDTYDFTPCMPLIRWLKQNGVPVIPTTSKTKAEILAFRKTAALETPFIVENGAAVYIPIDYFDELPKSCRTEDNFLIHEFVKPRAHWQNILSRLSPHLKSKLIGFSEMKTGDIVKATGLKDTEAKLAADRSYGEPFLWHGSADELSELRQFMDNAGANILKGGRFYHLSGNCSKGSALSWLTKQYKLNNNIEYQTIAIGDSQNDVSMLEIADKSIVVFSQHRSSALALEKNIDVYRTKNTAPKGWSEGLYYFLNSLSE